MDDVALISNDEKEMQQMLDITDHIAKKYHIEFGQSKSESLIIGKSPTPPKFKLGNQVLNNTNQYKYLGITINNKNDISNHIKNIKSKTEAAYQTVLTILHDPNFCGIQMKAVWKLLESCLIPVITHNLEAINLKQKEIKELDKIWENILKRILKTPITTPKESLYIETGQIDIKTIIERNRMRMAARIQNTDNKLLKAIQTENTPTGWWDYTHKVMQKHQITTEDLIGSKSQINKRINETTNRTFLRTITESATNKSKVQYLLNGINQWTKIKTQPYLNLLTRNTASIIFLTRNRMLKVKSNYKNAHSNPICRLCKTHEENQQHILNECITIHVDQSSKVDKSETFSKNTTSYKNTAQKINEIINHLSKYQ